MNMNQALAVILLTIAIVCSTATAEQVEFNYNGRINVQGQPFDGVGEFKFAIVDRPGQLTYWSNDGTSVAGSEPTSDSIELAVTNGFFSVNIGDIETTGMQPLSPTLFNADDPVFLRVWFNDGVHGFERMNPDRRIVNPALLGITTGPGGLNLYVDAVNGDDDNNGLTTDSAKQTIQAAVDTLPKRINGDTTVKVLPGVYRETVYLSGFMGEKDFRLNLIGDETWTTDSLQVPAVRVTGSDEDTTHTVVRDYGIRVSQCHNLGIQGFLIDYTGDGIEVSSSDNTSIENCQVSNASHWGIAAGSGTDMIVKSCVVSQNHRGTNFINCHVMLYDLVVDNNAEHGLRAASAFIQLFNNTVSTNNGGDGLSLWQAEAILRGTGVYEGNGRTGIRCVMGSKLYFEPPYSGEVKNNTEEGILSDKGSIVLNAVANTFGGNGGGAFDDTVSNDGGAFY